MSKNNAICAICGKPYHMCLACKDALSLNPWKRYTDTSEHYKVYQIIHGFSTGIYSKAEAKEKLSTVDLSDKSTYRGHIKVLIDDILNFESQLTADDNAEIDEKKVTVKRTKNSKAVKTAEV